MVGDCIIKYFSALCFKDVEEDQKILLVELGIIKGSRWRLGYSLLVQALVFLDR